MEKLIKIKDKEYIFYIIYIVLVITSSVYFIFSKGYMHLFLSSILFLVSLQIKTKMTIHKVEKYINVYFLVLTIMLMGGLFNFVAMENNNDLMPVKCYLIQCPADFDGVHFYYYENESHLIKHEFLADIFLLELPNQYVMFSIGDTFLVFALVLFFIVNILIVRDIKKIIKLRKTIYYNEKPKIQKQIKI